MSLLRNSELRADFTHVLPWLRRTSASLSFPMTCSALQKEEAPVVTREPLRL